MPVTAHRRSWAAYAVLGWTAFFAIVHVYWLVGGTVGLPSGKRVTDNTGLLVADIVAIPLCIAGAWLALGLTQPERTKPCPRTLQGLAWGTAALAVIHAAPAMVSWLLRPLGIDDGDLTEEERFSLFLYEPFWLLGGILFGLAALDHRRTMRRAQRAA